MNYGSGIRRYRMSFNRMERQQTPRHLYNRPGNHSGGMDVSCGCGSCVHILRENDCIDWRIDRLTESLGDNN